MNTSADTVRKGAKPPPTPLGFLWMKGTPADDLEVPTPRTIQHILVPTDFSENSLAALDYAVPFAEQFGAHLTLLHIVEAAPLPDAKGFYDLPPERLVQESEKIVAGLASAYAPKEERDMIATQVGVGTPAVEICRLALEREVDLIILNSHGYTGLQRALLGGITREILQHAPCPVLVIRRDHELEPIETRPLRTLLVPVDFSPRAEKAIHCAAALARKSHGTVSLLHVVQPREVDEEMAMIGADFAAYSADVQSRLHALLERTVPEPLRGAASVRRGCAYAEVVAEAARRDVDLIVLTTHGHSEWADLLLGNTAERVIHHTQCPVVVVRANGR